MVFSDCVCLTKLGFLKKQVNMAGPSPAAFFENTSLAFKYLHGEFENDDERDQFAAQLTVEF